MSVTEPNTRRERSIVDVVPGSGGSFGADVLMAAREPATLDGLAVDILDATATVGERSVLVTTGESGRTSDSPLDGVAGLTHDRVGVVDCTRDPTGLSVDYRGRRWSVSSPTDLTETGIALGELFSTLDGRDVDDVHVLFDSLTTPLCQEDSQQILEFVHHLRLASTERGGIGLYPVYTRWTTSRDMARLEHVFDGIVEVEQRNGERFARGRGQSMAPTEWVRLREPPQVGRLAHPD